MKKIIIDRNIINLLSISLSDKPITDQKKIEMIETLKQLDVPDNTISPLFSVIEGQKGRKETSEEMSQTLEKELGIMDRFFRNAQVDHALKDPIVKKKFLDTFLLHDLANKKEIESFLASTLLEVKDKKSITEAEKVKDRILQVAIKSKLSLSHPVVLLVLSCLFGNNDSCKILKPNSYDKDSYNVYSDIKHLMLFLELKTSETKDVTVEFISLDHGLISFINIIEFVYAKKIQDRKEFNISFVENIFPNIKDEFMLNFLYKELEKNNYEIVLLLFGCCPERKKEIKKIIIDYDIVFEKIKDPDNKAIIYCTKNKVCFNQFFLDKFEKFVCNIMIDIDIFNTELEDKQFDEFLARMASQEKSHCFVEADMNRDKMPEVEKIAWDLMLLATGYAFLHEIGHVVHSNSQEKYVILEQKCDTFANDFMMSNINHFTNNKNEQKMVELKRLLGMLLATTYMLLESTTENISKDSRTHPSLISRIEKIYDQIKKYDDENQGNESIDISILHKFIYYTLLLLMKFHNVEIRTVRDNEPIKEKTKKLIDQIKKHKDLRL